MGSEKGFIDFVLDAQNSRQLAKDFLKSSTSEEMKNFFSENGYAVAPDECEKLIKIKNNTIESMVDNVKY